MFWIYFGSVFCILVVLALLFIFLESRKENRCIKITRYRLNTDKLGDEFDNFKIVMFSDLHNAFFLEDEENGFLLETIQNVNPDMVVLGGDMIVCHSGVEAENARTANFLNRLAEKEQVYYGVGNHESGSRDRIKKVGDIWEDYKERLSEKIHYMDNKVVEIKRGNSTLRLLGLDLGGKYYRRFIAKNLTVEDINSKIGKSRKDEFNVLIAHNPDYFPVYADWGADLVFSGHNHGGLVRIPKLGGVISPRFRIFPKYDYGIYRKNNACMVLSNGLGAHSIKIRVNNYPEIVILEINKKE